MLPSDILRHIFSTLIYIVVLFFVLWGNNLLINWGMHHWIGPFFDWFYGLNTFLKIMFILLAGTTSLIIVFGLFMWVVKIVGMILSFIFLYNKAAYYISILMVLTNIVFAAVYMWPLIVWNFWVIIIWLMLFWFVVQMNWAFVFKDRKEIDRQAGIEPY